MNVFCLLIIGYIVNFIKKIVSLPKDPTQIINCNRAFSFFDRFESVRNMSSSIASIKRCSPGAIQIKRPEINKSRLKLISSFIEMARFEFEESSFMKNGRDLNRIKDKLCLKMNDYSNLLGAKIKILGYEKLGLWHVAIVRIIIPSNSPRKKR